MEHRKLAGLLSTAKSLAAWCAKLAARTQHEPKILTKYSEFQLVFVWRPEITVPFGAITKIEMFKLDEVCNDLVCLNVFHKESNDLYALFINEELEGYDALLERLEKLPGFDCSWPRKIIKPAFAENRTVVYEALKSG
ncbi:hypothetical protein [Pelagibius sp. Alg239-R121]|uniref:hypothetical protein n=1 Tax=Pelagibius sp. Alg239-R121 TaxID=2993448 RepID=UPI0024A64767|nr:hypothetical protein [Pelagibius sp. Alg239-R121]